MSNLKIVKTFLSTEITPEARLVVLASAGVIALATDENQPILGAADLGCSVAGDALGIALSGNGMKVELGETLAAGAYITAGAEGKAVAAVAGKYKAGRLLEGGVATDLVLYIPQDALHAVPA